jgi:hypothetical protein
MNVSGRSAITELDSRCVQIRWITPDYSPQRIESLFCSYTPSSRPSENALGGSPGSLGGRPDQRIPEPARVEFIEIPRHSDDL